MLKDPEFITPNVHALWPEFEIELPDGGKIPRFVTSYIIEGENPAVIDTAVEPAVPFIFDFIEGSGLRPEDVNIVINTHCHFDHIGGNRVFQDRASPRFYAHPAARPYIEDIALQMSVRPVGKMNEMCSGPVRIDEEINEGDVIDLGGGVEIRVLHTPGHSAGSVSLCVPKDGALICGDVLPEPGTLPIYEDVGQTLKSLDKLRAVEGADFLLSAMSLRVARGKAEIAARIDEGEAYIRRIDRLVRQAVRGPASRPRVEEIGRRVFAGLGLPEGGLIPIVLRTFQAHLDSEPLDEDDGPMNPPG